VRKKGDDTKMIMKREPCKKMTDIRKGTKRTHGVFGNSRAGLVLVLALIWTGLGTAFAGPAERIRDYHSQIEVFRDGHLIVTETITVVSAGKKIKRGIYRDFPTIYKAHSGKTLRVDFKIMSVLKDNRPESYHTKSISNGVRVYIGRKNVFLKPGTYTYTLTYRTDRQLGFFKDHDELYWNVTGNGWRFPIEKAGATVLLPPGTDVIEATAYTGRQGARGRAFKQSLDETGNVTFETTAPLGTREGLTIAVSWPKGVVTAPTLKDRLNVAVRHNASGIAALIGLIVLFGYYLGAWVKVGRDPRRGPIIPLFYPPDGFSPAAVRYLEKMSFDNKSFAAALVDMAVKGALTITKDTDGAFILEKKAGSDPAILSRGEKKALAKLFQSRSRITLKKGSRADIQAAISALKKTLKVDLEKVCFARNTAYLIPGVAITIISLVAIILTARDVSGAIGMGLWLSMWTVGCAFLVTTAIGAWRRKGPRLVRKGGAVFTSLFSVPFLIGEFFGLWVFSRAVSFQAALFFIGIVLLTPVFYHLLKAPTLYGQKMLDQIDGFRQYLSVAETARLEILNPPEKTPALFEKWLPYAMALDVENEWGKQFADVLRQANDGAGYRAGWYMSDRPGFIDTRHLAGDIGGSLTGAISSAAAAPGSSSGFGGGGSSGGGGGGGGGGGW